ncbi:MAG: hypothetical protein RLZZ455_438 [Candidatus Parcubacteria bacterium]
MKHLHRRLVNSLKIQSNKYVLLFLLIVGLLIRTVDLQHLPEGFFADEASIGYNAYTIAHTGKDEHGTQFPFFFEAFGEYKNPIAIYSTVPFVLLLGLHEWSVRLVSALYGTAGIFSIYLLTHALFKKHSARNVIALLSAFFLTISPWDIHLSRVMLEGITAFLFFTMMGTYFFLRIHDHVRRNLLLSTFFFSLSFYSYFPARLFIPLFSLSLLIIFHKTLFLKKHINTLLITGALLLIASLPILMSLSNQTLLSRWQQVSIFSNHAPNENPIAHIAYNYLSHFSPEFLFLTGDSGMKGQAITRHSVRGFGELYLIQLPLILAGIYFLLTKDRRTLSLLLTWLLLYPLGSMFTTDTSAQATRSVIGVVPFTILSGLGTWHLVNFSSRKAGFLGKITSVFFFALLLSSCIFYLKTYFQNYNMYASDFWGWQYGPREIMHFFREHHNEYDDVYMSGEFNGSHIFLRFYDPENTCSGKCQTGDFLREASVYQSDRKQLFSLSPAYLNQSEYREKFKTIKTIFYPDQRVAFKIGVIVQ